MHAKGVLQIGCAAHTIFFSVKPDTIIFWQAIFDLTPIRMCGLGESYT